MSLPMEWFHQRAEREARRNREGVSREAALKVLDMANSTVWPVATEMAVWLYKHWTMQAIYELPENYRDYVLRVVEADCDYPGVKKMRQQRKQAETRYRLVCLNAYRFRTAFNKTWMHCLRTTPAESLVSQYQNPTEWHQCLFGRLDATTAKPIPGLLAQVCLELDIQGLAYRQEPSGPSALLVSGKPELDGKLFLRHQCAIEHSQDGNPEAALWKLIFWRSPLKVLVFYDYPADEATPDNQESTWLAGKKQSLLDMIRKAAEFYPEADHTEYLFLVGRQPSANEVPQWRSFSSRDKGMRPLDAVVRHGPTTFTASFGGPRLED